MADISSAPAVVPKAALPAQTADTPHDRRMFWLGVLIVVAVMAIIALLFFVSIPAPNKDVLNTVIGVVVGTGFGSVVGFYYGSSQSSKTKDDALSNLVRG